MPARQSLRSRLMEDPKDTRRKQIQESLNQLDEREKQRKKKLNLRTLIAQAGIDLSIRMFWMLSLVLGIVMAIVPFVFALPWYVSRWLRSCRFSRFAAVVYQVPAHPPAECLSE